MSLTLRYARTPIHLLRSPDEHGGWNHELHFTKLLALIILYKESIVNENACCPISKFLHVLTCWRVPLDADHDD